MDSCHILLIDTSISSKRLLEGKLPSGNTAMFSVSLVRPTSRTTSLRKITTNVRVVLYGPGVGLRAITAWARSLHENGITAPMFVLREGNETVIPKNLRRVGIEDVLNVAELDTPVFWWTFMSMLRQAEGRRKANAFDSMADQLDELGKTLALITHEVNSPLSIIRLGLYHLQNLDNSPEKRQSVIKLLSESTERIQAQMEELRSVRRGLGKHQNCRTNGSQQSPQPARNAASSS